jgi:TonB family protein
LSYYPQDERKDKYFRFISVRVKTRPALRVRARKGFYPDSAQGSQNTNAGPSQFTGTRANAGANANEVAAAKRRTAESGAPAPARAAKTSGRARPGPDGPDTEEPAKPNGKADETTPTFTLTTSAPAPATVAATPQTYNSSSLFSAAPERTVASAAVETNAPADTAATTRTPEPAAAPQTELRSGPNSDAATASAPGDDAGSAKARSGGEGVKAPVSGGVLNGKALRLPIPIYPAAAKTYGASGTVVVEVMVDEQGKVIEARAVNGHPFLQQAAVHAARQARFTPAKLSGEPVKIKGTINYVFTLP